MPSIEVLSNLPPPPPAVNLDGPAKYPWKEMTVGQCFIFPAETIETHARTYASRVGREMKRRFSVRRIREGEHAGRFGCWRIA